MKRALSFLVASACIVAMFAECKPSAGGSCTENAKSCDTPTSRMACVDGKYTPQSCKGPNGCKEEKGTTSCDATKADVGDPCAVANQTVCSTDLKSKLRCDEGKFILAARCAKGDCQITDSGEGNCTWPYMKEGDACKVKPGQSERGAGACSEDNKGELR